MMQLDDTFSIANCWNNINTVEDLDQENTYIDGECKKNAITGEEIWRDGTKN